MLERTITTYEWADFSPGDVVSVGGFLYVVKIVESSVCMTVHPPTWYWSAYAHIRAEVQFTVSRVWTEIWDRLTEGRD